MSRVSRVYSGRNTQLYRNRQGLKNILRGVGNHFRWIINFRVFEQMSLRSQTGHLWVRKLWFSWNRLPAIPKAILKALSVNGWFGTIPMGWPISPQALYVTLSLPSGSKWYRMGNQNPSTSSIKHIESPIGYSREPHSSFIIGLILCKMTFELFPCELPNGRSFEGIFLFSI